MNYKYSIGDKVKVKDSNWEFQIEGRKTVIHRVEVDGEPSTITSNIYTDTKSGTGWILESDLEKVENGNH